VLKTVVQRGFDFFTDKLLQTNIFSQKMLQVLLEDEQLQKCIDLLSKPEPVRFFNHNSS